MCDLSEFGCVAAFTSRSPSGWWAWARSARRPGWSSFRRPGLLGPRAAADCGVRRAGRRTVRRFELLLRRDPLWLGDRAESHHVRDGTSHRGAPVFRTTRPPPCATIAGVLGENGFSTARGRVRHLDSNEREEYGRRCTVTEGSATLGWVAVVTGHVVDLLVQYGSGLSASMATAPASIRERARRRGFRPYPPGPASVSTLDR